MINGAHAIIYSKDAEADRKFFREVLRFSHVDVGGGWLIFALPPSEVAIHPDERNDVHEFYLMCDDVEEFRTEMKRAGVATSDVVRQPWGALTHVTLPGGGKLGVYQPRHERPAAKKTVSGRARTSAARKPAKKAPQRSAKKAPRRPSRSR